MEIYQLNSFIAVAESGNLTRAAKNMHISQSALSSQIKALEEELKNYLFIRGAKGMMLTPEGKALLADARKIVRAADRMKQNALEMKENAMGTLSIGINTDPEFLMVSDISRQMAAVLPRVSLSFLETQSFQTGKRLKNEEIDVGFHFGVTDEPDLFTLLLEEVDICVAIPHGLSSAVRERGLEAIVTLPWVWSRYECPFHLVFKQELEKQGLSVMPVADAADEDIVRELVKSGTGAAVMRKTDARLLENEGLAVVWDGLGMALPLCVSCLENRKTEKLIASFLEVLRARRNNC